MAFDSFLTIQNGVAATVSLVTAIFLMPIFLPITTMILNLMGLGALKTIMTLVTWLLIFYVVFVVTIQKLTDRGGA